MKARDEIVVNRLGAIPSIRDALALCGEDICLGTVADIAANRGSLLFGVCLKLFAIYIGGEHPAAHIEAHDMRFVVAPLMEETKSALLHQWWGTPGTLHVDCWTELDQADGYDIVLSPELFAGPEKLFYVNIGGYSPSESTELHRNIFVVATSLKEAKIRALEAGRGWSDLHKDDVYEAEQAFALDQIVGESRLHIHLAKADKERPLRFTCNYWPIKDAS